MHNLDVVLKRPDLELRTLCLVSICLRNIIRQELQLVALQVSMSHVWLVKIVVEEVFMVVFLDTGLGFLSCERCVQLLIFARYFSRP